MDIIPKQVLDLATKYIGYKEKASNKSSHVFADEAGVNALSLDGSTAVDGSDTIVSGATYTIINWGG